MYRIPGACIRIAFVPLGTSSHSQEFVDAGKTQEAHEVVLLAAKILAASAVQMIMEPQLLQDIKEEFASRRNVSAN